MSLFIGSLLLLCLPASGSDPMAPAACYKNGEAESCTQTSSTGPEVDLHSLLQVDMTLGGSLSQRRPSSIKDGDKILDDIDDEEEEILDEDEETTKRPIDIKDEDDILDDTDEEEEDDILDDDEETTKRPKDIKDEDDILDDNDEEEEDDILDDDEEEEEEEEDMCTAPPALRKECGKVGSTKAACEAGGCCWGELEKGSEEPWCFKKMAPLPQTCDVERGNRKDCGIKTTTSDECKKKKGCCWGPLEENSQEPWCFFSEPKEHKCKAQEIDRKRLTLTGCPLLFADCAMCPQCEWSLKKGRCLCKEEGGCGVKGNWVLKAKNSYCRRNGRYGGGVARTLNLSLGKGISAKQCQAAAQANSKCGAQIYSNGKECRCVKSGMVCDIIPSSRRNNVYEYRFWATK